MGAMRRAARLCAIAAALCAACGPDAVPIPPTITPTKVDAPSPRVAAAPTPSADFDPNAAMYAVFPGFGMTSDRTYEALDGIRRAGDKAMVAPLVESMRFQATPRAREAVAAALRELTGADYGGEDWNGWMEWLGRNSADYPPPSEYLNWKIRYLGRLDGRFADFLRPALDGAIDADPTELVWGGVLPDGIPDIRNPIMLRADEADFLDDDERVFGVNINGDARAYPLRVANAHEMVNDTVGGEPIALAW